MYILYPIAYPTSLILNYFLGASGGTIYKKAGLKCLVSMHQSDDMEGLTEDEVHIISSVLDLKEKRVYDIMIALEDVFTLSIDTVLDKTLVNKLLKQGYSRIPITAASNKHDFIGMLLVKNLIGQDHDEQFTVSQLPLSPLPETNPKTSSLDILNFFREGTSKRKEEYKTIENDNCL
jgi:CBS domain containing-hemolysin-like protein